MRVACLFHLQEYDAKCIAYANRRTQRKICLKRSEFVGSMHYHFFRLFEEHPLSFIDIHTPPLHIYTRIDTHSSQHQKCFRRLKSFPSDTLS